MELVFVNFQQRQSGKDVSSWPPTYRQVWGPGCNEIHAHFISTPTLQHCCQMTIIIIIFIDTQNLSNAANKQAPPLQLQASLRKMEALLAGLVFLASLTAESGQTNSKPASCCRLSNRLTPIPIHFRPDLSLEALPSETSQRNKFLLPVRPVSWLVPRS